MQVTSNIRMDDHRAFTRYVWYSGARGSWLWFLLIFIAVVVITVLMEVRTGLRLDTPTMLMTMVILTAYLALAQRRIRPIADGVALGLRTFEIENEGLRERSKHYESLTRWSGVRSVDETRDHIFVFIDNCEAHIIPKRAFRNDEEACMFVDALRTRASSDAHACDATPAAAGTAVV